MLDLHPIVVFVACLAAGVAVLLLGVSLGRSSREREVDAWAHERAEAVNDAINWRQRCEEVRESAAARGRALTHALAARPGVARLAAITVECDHALSQQAKEAALWEIELLRPKQEEELTAETQRAPEGASKPGCEAPASPPSSAPSAPLR